MIQSFAAHKYSFQYTGSAEDIDCSLIEIIHVGKHIWCGNGLTRASISTYHPASALRELTDGSGHQ